MKLTVEVRYTIHLVSVLDESDAVEFVGYSLPIVTNPQTGERVEPEIEAYEEKT